MCLLGTLKTFSFDKQIYIHLKVQKFSGDYLNLEVWNLKSQFKMAAEKPCARFESICHNKNKRTTFKMITKKLIEPSTNIIVTWKVTIPL